MKRFLQSLLVLAAIVAACIILNPAEAQAASTSDLSFTLNSDRASYSVKAKSTSISGALTIPSNYNGKPVTTIRERAFNNCKALTSVTIPDSVTTIGKNAFYSCGSLTSVTIPDSVTTIGDYAFFACTSLTSITIPDSVTTIGKTAFCNCKALTSVSIGDSVTTIGDSAFNGCDSLASITIPDSVTTIGKAAFNSCDSLTSVTIGKSVTTIGDSAFFVCDSLTSVTIPDSVTTIGANAFLGCTSLTGIWVDEDNPSYSSDGVGVLFNKDKTLLIAAPGAIVSYTLPGSVTAIGDYAFSDRYSLTSITIPDSVATIGDYAFSACTSLTGIWVDEDNPNYSSDGLGVLFNKDKTLLIVAPGAIVSYTLPDSVTTIGDYAFDSCCYSLTSIIIPDSVTTIGNYAFNDCKGLTSVTIGDSVATIGDFAFCECDSLTSITIPDSVTTIGNHAFNACDSLTGIWVDEDNPSYSSDGLGVLFNKDKTLLITAPSTIVSYTLPDSVTTIGNNAFYSCDSLTSITIPDSVTTIGDFAFYSCDSLTDVYYTGTQEQWSAISIGSSNTYLTEAKLNLVSRCTAYGHTEVIIPGKAATCTEPGLTEGKKCAVCDTVLVAQEEIPALLTFTLDSKGQYYTLTDCDTSATGEVTIPATYNGLPVTVIGPSAFSGCTKVQAINIPASIQKIGYAAFYNCKALTEITIPEGITDVLYSTFAGCTGLVKVTLPSTLKQIGELAFDNCKNLTTINIPEGVTTISRVAFFNCRSLDGINLPKTLTTLGESAFYDCKSLTSITIPGSLTRLQKSTFYGCSKLETLVIEDGVKTVEDYVFYGCVSLKTVTFTSGVTYIGTSAFDMCYALSDVYYSGTQAQWDALALGISNAYLADATLHLQGPCSEGHIYDHDYDKDCNVCTEVRQLNNTYKFVNYRVVFADPDTTHKNLRVEVYRLEDQTVADPTDEKALKAIDASPVTHWGASRINNILLTDAGNYVLLLKYNIGTSSAIKVPMEISVSADPKLIIDKNNKITAIDEDPANINHRVVVYYLGENTVEDIYDEAALKAIDSAPETHWQMTRINRLALTKGGNYVLHLCYNQAGSAKITVAQQFTVFAIPTVAVSINNKLVVTEENPENRNHRATVFYLGEGTVEDPFDEVEVKAAAISSKTYWGISAINKVELLEGGNYVIHLYYNVGTSEKRTLALDVTLDERPVLSLREDNRLLVSYSDLDITNPRAYIYKVDGAAVSDIYDEAALKAIATPTQIWGLSSILNKQLSEPGTYVIHLYYNVGTSAKKTVAIKVTT